LLGLLVGTTNAFYFDLELLEQVIGNKRSKAFVSKRIIWKNNLIFLID
jgi:hypothetical protein